jgi:hypothetical protein
MPDRATFRVVHLVAGIVGFLTIAAFWLATVAVEIAGDQTTIAAVKQAIVWGLVVLIPALAATGGSGFNLGGRSRARVIAIKRRRMVAVALNGLLVLVPSAFFLAGRATASDFGAGFILVQGIELAAGAVNMTLMGLNMRDGFRLTAGRRSSHANMA